MYFGYSIAGLLAIVSGTVTALPSSNGLSHDKRQSTVWQDKCGNTTPADFRAFNLGNCEAQLTFTRGQNVGVQWNFDAVYSDGSRVNHKPFQDYNNIAVSDPFYAIGYGNNYITNRAQSKAFTSVHEFSSVCKNGAAPTAWIFYTSSASSACTSSSYRYTTGKITTASGTRPGRASFSGKSSANGDITVSWAPVTGAASYNVLLRVPTGRYEDYSGYFVAYRGARIQAPSTSFILSGVSSSRYPEEPRKLVVNVVNSQGVWSYTPSTKPADVYVPA